MLNSLLNKLHNKFNIKVYIPCKHTYIPISLHLQIFQSYIREITVANKVARPSPKEREIEFALDVPGVPIALAS